MTCAGVHNSFEATGLKRTREQACEMLRHNGTATVIGMIPVGKWTEMDGESLCSTRRHSRTRTSARLVSGSTLRAMSTPTCRQAPPRRDGEVARNVIVFG